MNISSSKRGLLAALLLLLGASAAHAQPSVTGDTSVFPLQVKVNSLCTDTTNLDTGFERESAGVFSVTDCGTTDYATRGAGGRNAAASRPPVM